MTNLVYASKTSFVEIAQKITKLWGVNIFATKPYRKIFSAKEIFLTRWQFTSFFLVKWLIYVIYYFLQVANTFCCFQIRATLKYIQDNQFPAVTVFRDNRPHYFRRDEHSGTWQPVRYWIFRCQFLKLLVYIFLQIQKLLFKMSCINKSCCDT